MPAPPSNHYRTLWLAPQTLSAFGDSLAVHAVYVHAKVVRAAGAAYRVRISRKGLVQSTNALEELAATDQSFEHSPRLPVADDAGAEREHSERAAVRAGSWIPFPQASRADVRSCLMHWNGQWVTGDRFARDYAAGILLFDSEATQSVARFHPARHCAEVRDFETHAMVWASVLVSFDAAGFRDRDRETLLAALLVELRLAWCTGEPPHSILEAAILERALIYLAVRDRSSPMTTARSIVNSYLSAVGVPEPTASFALARHLWALFGYRVCRDIYRLGVASRMRLAAVSLAAGRKPAQS